MRKSHLVIGASVLLAGAAIVAPAEAIGDVTVPLAMRQTVSGAGSDVPALSPITAPVVVTLTYEGSDNFIVRPVNRDGDEGISWANEIGTWSGTIFQGKPSVPIVAASVEADGNWKIAIKPLAAAPVVSARRYSGSGYSVVKFRASSSGFKRIKFTHDGESNFIVRPISSSGSEGISLVNEIGPYAGTKVLPKGTRYLSVIADGAWSFSIS